MPSRNAIQRVVSNFLWRSCDRLGYERGELIQQGDSYRLNGSVVRGSKNGPAEVNYTVSCDRDWITRDVIVNYKEMGQSRSVSLTRRKTGWSLNGCELKIDDICMDIDIEWTPATNTLPIRRLALEVGASAECVNAVWVRLPELRIELLRQSYRRISSGVYEYTSDHSDRTVQLAVDEHGIVIDYEGGWERLSHNNASTESPERQG